MILRNWQANGWLLRHESSPEEVSDLLDVIERDLEDAGLDRLSADWRLDWLQREHSELLPRG